MMSSCIAVFRAPSSCPMSCFIFTLWLPSSKNRIAATDRTVVVYMSGVGESPRLLKICALPASGSLRFVLDRVHRAGRGEGLPALPAGDTGAAMDRAVPVTGPRDIEGDVHFEAHADDLLLRLSAQRHEDLHGGLVIGPEAEVEHAVQEIEELRARVGERFRVDSVVAADEVSRGIEFGIVTREAVEN